MKPHTSDTWFSISDVTAMVGVRANCTIYRLIKRDAFPRPIKIGAKSVWSGREINEWMTTKATARQAV